MMKNQPSGSKQIELRILVEVHDPKALLRYANQEADNWGLDRSIVDLSEAAREALVLNVIPGGPLVAGMEILAVQHFEC